MQRVATGAGRQGLMVRRSTLRPDFAAVRGLGSRGRTNAKRTSKFADGPQHASCRKVRCLRRATREARWGN
jgi:hypothetical protein